MSGLRMNGAARLLPSFNHCAFMTCAGHLPLCRAPTVVQGTYRYTGHLPLPVTTVERAYHLAGDKNFLRWLIEFGGIDVYRSLS